MYAQKGSFMTRLRFLKRSTLVALLLSVSLLVLVQSLTTRPRDAAAGLLRSSVLAQAPTGSPSPPAVPGDGTGDGLCTEVDALMALKMAVGLTAPDLAKMDVDGDGRVTEVDALQILKWAVSGGQCRGPTPQPPVAEQMVKTEDEAIKAADERIAQDFPDMVGAEQTVQSYETHAGEFFDVTYKRTVEAESEGETVELPKVVIVSINKDTGEQSIAVSD